MTRTIIQFVLVGILVAIIGGFAGWYFFLKGQTNDTLASDAGRGSQDNASFSGEVGSTYQHIAEGGITSSEEVGNRAPRLWHVSLTPVAGFGFDENSAAVFIAERATGNILRADPEISAIVRLTNTLIPKVREAVFSRSGDVVLQTTNDRNAVTSFAATIATTTERTSTSTPNVLSGSYLPEDIVAIDAQNLQPTSRGILYIAKNPDGGSVGVTSTWKGLSPKILFTSGIVQWRVQWLTDGRAIITQNASDGVSGFSFAVSPSGTMTSLVSDKPGLTVVHHDTSNALLFGTSKDGVVELFVQVGSAAPTKLPVSTTADKCVWAPGVGLIAYCGVPQTTEDPQFLNRWYQGALHTQDAIWRVEAASGNTERIFATDTRVALDVENPAIDASGTYLGFRDAADKSLWLLRLSE